MAQKNLILCIDVGGDSIKAAEFSFTSGQGLVLERFAYTEYDYSSDELGEDVILKAISDVITTNNFSASDVYVSISGKNAFVRFVKIPAMTSDKAKIQEIVSYEAKQGIPLSPDEIVWDSQLMDSVGEDSTEIDAMIVIVKKDIVSRISELVERLHKRIALIEVAGTSCYNAARANNIGANDCQILLDIGGRCSTLIFLDGTRFFVRSIPIAGDTITQQIAKEFNISYADAEEMKRKHGYVALGGAYEDSDSEIGAAVSKIVRNVMTRLHSEINRSINLYRATQKGRKPEKLFLAGGTSILPFAQKFFEEKLNVPVEYFNAFQVVAIGENVDQEVLSQVAHLFPETIGLALRRIGTSPVEITLVPDHVKKQVAFRAKRIYFYITAIVILAYLGITYWAYSQQAANITEKSETFSSFVERKKIIEKRVKDANSALTTAVSNYEMATEFLKKRNNTLAFFSVFRKCVPDNVWFTDVAITSQVNPAITSAQDSSRASDEEAKDGEKKNKDLSFNPNSDENNSEDKDKKKKDESANSSTVLTWLNVTAYVICKKESTKQTDRSAAINIFTTNLKKTGLFKANEDEIQLVYDEGANFCDSLTICKFLLAIELKAPLDDPEFEKLLFPEEGDENKEDEE